MSKKISTFRTATNRTEDYAVVANLCYMYAMLSMSMRGLKDLAITGRGMSMGLRALVIYRIMLLMRTFWEFAVHRPFTVSS